MTIRNYVVFHSFVPVSVGFGTTFVEGLGEMDSDGRTGMPTLDEGVMEMDAAHAGRPDYYGNLYAPDGIARVVAAIGIDGYHLGVIFLLNLEIGYVHPPVGLNLFISSFRFRKPMTELYWAVVPFLLIMLATLIAVTGSIKRNGRLTSIILPAANFTSVALSAAVGS